MRPGQEVEAKKHAHTIKFCERYSTASKFQRGICMNRIQWQNLGAAFTVGFNKFRLYYIYLSKIASL